MIFYIVIKKTKLYRCPVFKKGSLHVPEGVESIERYAFRASGIDLCEHIDEHLSVHLPLSLQCIKRGAFKSSN